ncbi:MAG: hypothetical protein JOZ89_08865 [Gammaproteobacteria bacterium]|nr:hypothetical protein [Gammaproteobacteria bacterium]
MPELARPALRISASTGVLAFWCGMWIAAERYPSEYDWRYITISSLVYPDRNPGGYLWAWAGVALCALAGLYWTGVRIRQGEHTAAASPAGEREAGPTRAAGVRALGVGYLCMMCCGLLPGPLLRLPKLHELLALTAFFGIGIGLVQSVRVAALPGNRRGYAAVLAGAAVSPIVLAALAQAYVSYALPRLPWVSLAWRTRGVPAYLSFAFWEWITCGVFSVYMLVLCWTTDPRR